MNEIGDLCQKLNTYVDMWSWKPITYEESQVSGLIKAYKSSELKTDAEHRLVREFLDANIDKLKFSY